MNKPICTKCHMEMARTKRGVTVIYLFQDPPIPYQAYAADLFTCSSCGYEVVGDMAIRSFWEHWHTRPLSSIPEIVEQINDQRQGNGIYFVNENPPFKFERPCEDQK